MFSAVVAAVLLVPAAAYACEPVPLVVMMSIMSMSSAPMVGFLLHSFVALVAVVAVKSCLFAYKSDMKFHAAFFLMVGANAYSTLPGIVCAVFMAIPTFLVLFGWIALYFLFKIPAERIVKLSGKNFRPVIVNVVLIIAAYVSMFLCMSVTFADPEPNAAYWTIKIIYATLGVAIGLVITIGYEEAFVAKLARRKEGGEKSYLQQVTWANVWTAMIFAVIAAGIALPQRLATPGFLLFVQRIVREFAG